MSNPAPVVGKWYARAGGDSFEVVAIDRDDATIELQYFDGTIEELDFDEWREEEIVAASAPEDWTGSVDVDPEDTENEFDAGARQWQQPVRSHRSWRGGRLLRTRIARRTAGAPRGLSSDQFGSRSGTESSSST